MQGPRPACVVCKVKGQLLMSLARCAARQQRHLFRQSTSSKIALTIVQQLQQAIQNGACSGGQLLWRSVLEHPAACAGDGRQVEQCSNGGLIHCFTQSQ